MVYYVQALTGKAGGAGGLLQTGSSWLQEGAVGQIWCHKKEGSGKSHVWGRKDAFIALHAGPPSPAGEPQSSVSTESLDVWLKNPNAAGFVQSFS